MGRKIHEPDYFHLDFLFLAHHVVTMSDVKKSQRVEIVFQSDMVTCGHFHLHFRHEKKKQNDENEERSAFLWHESKDILKLQQTVSEIWEREL